MLFALYIFLIRVFTQSLRPRLNELCVLEPLVAMNNVNERLGNKGRASREQCSQTPSFREKYNSIIISGSLS